MTQRPCSSVHDRLLAVSTTQQEGVSTPLFLDHRRCNSNPTRCLSMYTQQLVDIPNQLGRQRTSKTIQTPCPFEGRAFSNKNSSFDENLLVGS